MTATTRTGARGEPRTATDPRIAGPDATLADRMRAGWYRYWYEEIPPRRLAIFSFFVYGAVLFSVFVNDTWAQLHTWAPVEFYKPVFFAETLRIPPPNEITIWIVTAFVVGGCILGFTRRAPRVAGLIVLLSYGLWVTWAFSYGKIDHNQFATMVALFVLAVTPATGPAAPVLTGWGLRLVQVVFILTYPMSAISKMRANDWTFEWLNSATLVRAVVRRGTELGDSLIAIPNLMTISQWLIFWFEFVAIVILLPRGKLRYIGLAGVVALHVVTYSTITIHFLPHTICILAFFPLERGWAWISRRRERRQTDSSSEPDAVDAPSSGSESAVASASDPLAAPPSSSGKDGRPASPAPSES